MRKRRRLGGGLLAVAMLALAMLISACGSSSGSSGGNNSTSGGGASSTQATGGTSTSGGGTTTSAGSDASSEVAAAKAALVKISTPGGLAFPKPLGPVSPGSHRVAIIAAGLSGQGAKEVVPYIAQAAKAAGWTTPAPFDGQFSPTTQSGLIEQAVQSHYAGIFLVAITPSSVAQAVNTAYAAHIPVVCVNCGPDPNPKAVKGVIHTDPSATAAGIAQAQEAIALTNGKGTVAVFTDAEFGETITQNQAAIAYLKKHCPGCKVITQAMTVKDAIAPGVPLLTAFLSSHPKGTINVIIAPYDTAAAPFAQAAQQAGRTDVKFVSFGGLLPFYQQLLAGNPPNAIATTAAPIPYESWAAVDEMARHFAGKPLWDAANLPVELMTHANAATYDKSAPYAEPKGNFHAMFEKDWGTS